MLNPLAPLMAASLALQDAPDTASQFDLQGGGGPFGTGGADLSGMVGYYAIACSFSVISLGIVVWIYIVFTLSLMKVPREHRKMVPGLIWLNFIPCFNIIWTFFIAILVPKSLELALGARAQGTPTGRGAGMIWAVLTAVNFVISIIGMIIGFQVRNKKMQEGEPLTTGDFLFDMIGYPLLLVSFIFLIVFGLQVQRAAKMLVPGSGDSAKSTEVE